MKNLKKVLALVLAFACAFTMFAGAAFTDQADINDVNAEAVNTLVALGVIDGYEDGSFRPDDTVTRVEMAKMIYTIRTGRSDASAYNDDATSFTDITSHWARGYIKYCQSMGIIAGKSTTSFDPDATVTTQEAAKMLLVTLGYNAERAGLEGASWGQKTTALADENGLLTDVNNGTTQGLPRQYAAQLIYNAVNAPTVVWRDDAYTNEKYNGEENDTIGKKYMGLENPKGILTSVKYDDNDDVYTTVVGEKTFDAAADYSDLMGQEVRALYKEGKNGADDELYGLFATDSNNTVTAIYGDVDDDNRGDAVVEIDGTEYDLAKTFKTIATNGATILKDDYDNWGDYPYAEVTLVDNNDDDKYEFAVVNPFKVAQLTTLTAKKAYFEYVIGSATEGVNIDELTAYEDMAEDDYVLLTEGTYSVSGDWVATKAETVSGKVSGIRGDSILIDGNWYEKANDAIATPNNGADLEYAVVVNGYYFVTEGTSGSVDSLALVLKSGDQDFDGDYFNAKLLLSDGSVVVSKAYVKENDNKKTAPVVGTLYSYTSNSNGYVLEKIAKGSDIGLKDTAVTTGNEAYNSTTNKIDDIRVAADAQVFVLYEKSGSGASPSYSGKLISGASLDNWDNGTYKATAAYADGNVKVIVIDMDTKDLPNAADDSTYGVVLSKPYTITNDDNETYTFVEELWTENGLVEDAMFDGDVTSVVKMNALITFAQDGDIYVDAAATPDADKYFSRAVAITDVNGDYLNINITLGDKTYASEIKIDDDTTVLYFDSDSGEGSKTGTIKKAAKYDETKYYSNALVIYEQGADEDDAKKVAAIAVDMENMLLDSEGNELYTNVAVDA